MGMGFCNNGWETNVYLLEFGSFNFLKSNITSAFSGSSPVPIFIQKMISKSSKKQRDERQGNYPRFWECIYSLNKGWKVVFIYLCKRCPECCVAKDSEADSGFNRKQYYD